MMHYFFSVLGSKVCLKLTSESGLFVQPQESLLFNMGFKERWSHWDIIRAANKWAFEVPTACPIEWEKKKKIFNFQDL